MKITMSLGLWLGLVLMWCVLFLGALAIVFFILVRDAVHTPRVQPHVQRSEA